MVRPVIRFEALPPSHWSQVFCLCGRGLSIYSFRSYTSIACFQLSPIYAVLTQIHVYRIFLWRSLTSNTYQSKRCETNENTNGCNNTETISESFTVGAAFFRWFSIRAYVFYFLHTFFAFKYWFFPSVILDYVNVNTVLYIEICFLFIRSFERCYTFGGAFLISQHIHLSADWCQIEQKKN